MNISHFLYSQRLKLSMTQEEVARAAAISVEQYRDVEQHQDEFETALTLSEARRVASVLSLELNRDVLGLSVEQARSSLGREEIVKLARKRSSLSGLALSEALGFEEIVVAQMETDPDFFEQWPIELVRQTASVLDVPLHWLLDR